MGPPLCERNRTEDAIRVTTWDDFFRSSLTREERRSDRFVTAGVRVRRREVPARTIRDPSALLVKAEFLGVQQGPDQILVRDAGVTRIPADVFQRLRQLVGRGLVGERPEEQLLDLRGVGAGVPRQLVGQGAGAGDAVLDLV